jgi:hypothetical protein
MRLSEFYNFYSRNFVVGLAVEEIYSYVRDMRSRTCKPVTPAVSLSVGVSLQRKWIFGDGGGYPKCHFFLTVTWWSANN